MTRDRRPWSEAVYDRLLALYPREFRDRFGPELRQFFHDRRRDEIARLGSLGIARAWWRVLPDLLGTAFLERRAARRERTRAVRRLPAPRAGDPMIQTLAHDVRFTARSFRKSPVFTAVAVLVIALGTGAVTTIFSAANAIALRPIPSVARPGELVEIQRTQQQGDGALSASYPYYRMLRDGTRSMSGIVGWTMVPLTISGGKSAATSLGNIVTGNYFAVLGMHPALGRFFIADDDRTPGARAVVVISHGLWLRRFAGDTAIVGTSIGINGHPFTVIGVAPRGFHGIVTPFNTEIWVPMMMQDLVRPGNALLSRPGAAWLELFGRRRADATAGQVRADLAALTSAYAGVTEPADFKRFTGIRVSPLSGLPTDVYGPVLGFMGLLLAVAGLVLLIASANVAGMLLARASTRRREMALRIALGAGRPRLVRQLLTESLLLFVGGALGGVLLAVGGTRALQRIPLPVEVPSLLDLAPDLRVLAFALGVALVTGISFGLAPALAASRTDVAVQLRNDSAAAGSRRSRMRSSLVVGQLALSLLLLVCAGLFLRALDRGQRVNPGFDATNVAVASFDTRTFGYDTTRGRAFYDGLKARLSTHAGVTAVSFADVLPLSGNNTGDEFRIDGYEPPPGASERGIGMTFSHVDPDYFSVLHIPLLRGRTFAATDAPGTPEVAIVSETVARRFWPGGDAIGRTFHRDSSTITIVGVARDSKFGSLKESPRLFVYFPIAQRSNSQRSLIVRTAGDPALLAAAIRDEVAALDAALPVPSVTSLEAVTSVVLLPQRVAAAVTAALGVVGLVLAAVGLYGIVAYSVNQRTREIGVRMALGAVAGDVVRLVVREGMRLVAMGLAIGLALAVAATRLLSPYLFGVSATDGVTFVVIPALLAGVAALASYLPARRAAAGDPLAALRTD